MKIETLRCDICDGVYHSDEVNTEIIIATKDEDGDCKNYEHICPKCVNEVTSYIKDPTSIQKLRNVVIKEDKCVNKLENCLGTIKSVVSRFESYWRGSRDLDYYDEQTEYIREEILKIIEERDSIKESRNLWRRLSICFICGAIIGTILSFILA